MNDRTSEIAEQRRLDGEKEQGRGQARVGEQREKQKWKKSNFKSNY